MLKKHLAGIAASITAGVLVVIAIGPAAAYAAAAQRIVIVAPTAETLVPAKKLTVVAQVPTGATSVRVTTDEGDVTKAFSGRGTRRSAVLRNLPPGVEHISVRAKVRGKDTVAHVSVIVRGKHARLLRPADAKAGVLRFARGAGVKTVAFRARAGTNVQARLNGRPLHLSKPDATWTRDAVLNGGEGLRPGANRLSIVAFDRNGTYDTSQQVIRVTRSAPMASAGPDRHGVAGKPIRFDATASAPGTPGDSLSYRWRVVQAPKGVRPTLRGADGRRPTLTPRTAGQYVLAATVRERRRDGTTLRTTDLAESEVLLPVPPTGATLETMAPDPTGQTAGDGLLIDTSYAGTSSGDGGGQKFWYSRTGKFASGVGLFAIDPISLTVRSTALSSGNPDASLTSALQSVVPGSIVVLVGGDGCCTGGSVLPKSGAFSYVAVYDGQAAKDFLAAGTQNVGLKLSANGTAGDVVGKLRLDRSGAQPQYRFTVEDDVPYTTLVQDTPLPGNVVSGATLRVTSQLAGKVLDGGGLGVASNSTSQQWRFTAAYGDYYTLVADGQCLTENGASVVTADCGDHQLDQLWTASWQSTTRGYQLASAANPADVLTASDSGLSAAAAGSGPVTGQLWILDLAPGIYTIASADTGDVIGEADATGNAGDPLQLQRLTSAPTQLWRAVDGPQGMRFVNVASGQCMDLTGAFTATGTKIERWPCVPTAANQAWKVTVDTDGLGIFSVSSGKPIAHDVSDVGGPGSVFQADADRDDVPQKRWSLVRQGDPIVGGSYALTSATTNPGDAAPDSAPVGLAAQAVGGTSSVTRNVTGSAAQQWVLRDAGDGATWLYNPQTNMCLDRNDADVKTPPYTTYMGACLVPNAGYMSSWRLHKAADGRYFFSLFLATGWTDGVLTARSDGTLVADTDTGAPNRRWTLSGQTQTMAVGTQRYTVAPASSTSGFTVVALDQTLHAVAGTPLTYTTNGGSNDDSQINALATQLTSLSKTANTVILVQSFGNPHAESSAWNGLAMAIATIGGDHDSFLQHTGGYAIAGCSGCSGTRPPQFDESVMRYAKWYDEPHGGSLSGTLTRNEQSAYVASTGGPARLAPTFAALAARPATPWPFTDTSAGRAALQAIADKLGLTDQTCPVDIGPVRSAYCEGKGNNIDWASKKSTLDRLEYSDMGTNPAFSADLFVDVQKQLDVEFDEVATVRDLVDGVSQAYGWADDHAATNAQSVANTILSGINNPPLTTTSRAGGVFAVLKDTIDIAFQVGGLVGDSQPQPPPPVPDPDPLDPSSGFDTGLSFIQDFSKLVGGNSGGGQGVSLTLNSDAADYGNLLRLQFDAVIKNLPTAEDLIVSDPVKLQITAASANGSWDIGSDSGTLSAQLQAGVERQLYTRLLPSAFELWQWPTPPANFTLQGLWGDSGKASKWIYADPDKNNNPTNPLDPRAIWAPPPGVDASGVPQFPNHLSVLSMYGGNANLLANVDRKIKPALLNTILGDPAQGGAGFTALSLPALGFNSRTFSNELASHWLQWRNSKNSIVI